MRYAGPLSLTSLIQGHIVRGRVGEALRCRQAIHRAGARLWGSR